MGTPLRSIPGAAQRPNPTASGRSGEGRWRPRGPARPQLPDSWRTHRPSPPGTGRQSRAGQAPGFTPERDERRPPNSSPGQAAEFSAFGGGLLGFLPPLPAFEPRPGQFKHKNKIIKNFKKKKKKSRLVWVLPKAFYGHGESDEMRGAPRAERGRRPSAAARWGHGGAAGTTQLRGTKRHGEVAGRVPPRPAPRRLAAPARQRATPGLPSRLTLVPIWFPHWPAWMCTISLMAMTACLPSLPAAPQLSRRPNPAVRAAGPPFMDSGAVRAHPPPSPPR